MRRTKSYSNTRATRGFTLIELLVVIGIIVLLLAILMPALGRAKTMAQVARTEALMTHLTANIDGYFSTFQAYPGPASISETSGTTKQLSGAQNVLLGLSYGLYGGFGTPTAPTTPQVNLPWSPTLKVYPNSPNGPVNYANIGPNGFAEQLAPFFDANSKQISATVNPPVNTIWPATGVLGGTGSGFKFPVILDAFPDALPILYFRRSVGIDSPTVAANSSTPAAYYLDENSEYYNGKINGTSYDQTKGSFTSTNASRLADFSEIALGKGVTSARGSYVLLSAGIDRYYGKYNNSATSDDIVRVGGN